MTDWVSQVGIGIESGISIRIGTMDCLAWRSRRRTVGTVESAHIRDIWFVATNVLDIVVGGHDKLDE